jgi:hypothetical protein
MPIAIPLNVFFIFLFLLDCLSSLIDVEDTQVAGFGNRPISPASAIIYVGLGRSMEGDIPGEGSFFAFRRGLVSLRMGDPEPVGAVQHLGRCGNRPQRGFCSISKSIPKI